MIKATIKIVLDGKPMSDGRHAVCLRVLKDRKRKMISLWFKCQKEHFENGRFTKHHPDYQEENQVLLSLETRALGIIREFIKQQQDFSLSEFEKAFRGTEKEDEVFLLRFFDEIVEELSNSGNISNAKVYKDTKVSLLKFVKKDIPIDSISLKFLKKYESFLRNTGSKNGGVSIRMRTLRALYNKARKRRLIPKEPYPFEDYNISRLKGESTKIAITFEELQKIKNLDLSMYPELVNAHKYFLFSVFARGMNFYDMLLLRWSNIRNGRLYYVRSKTKGKFNIEIIPPAQEILDYFKAQNRPSSYVFPILLKDDLSPQQIFNRRYKTSAEYNRKLKAIAKLAGVEANLSSYVSRHSWATILKMKGTPIEKICEMMGHSDPSVTIAYLKEFSNEDLDIENRKFMDL